MTDGTVTDEGSAEYGVVIARAERLFEDVDRALERIDAHSYGLCEECGEAIGDERLAANPAAATCGQHLPIATTGT